MFHNPSQIAVSNAPSDDVNSKNYMNDDIKNTLQPVKDLNALECFKSEYLAMPSTRAEDRTTARNNITTRGNERLESIASRPNSIGSEERRWNSKVEKATKKIDPRHMVKQLLRHCKVQRTKNFNVSPTFREHNQFVYGPQDKIRTKTA